MEVPGTVPSSTVCPSCKGTVLLEGLEGLTHADCPHCGAPMVVPLQFNEFLLLKTIGFGGMGTVYKAKDVALNRTLAIKILRKQLASSPEFMANFRHEARAAATVNHPNVAKVFSFGEQEGQSFLAMELLEKGSLDDRLTKLGKLPEKEVLDIGIQIAGGLQAAFEGGLLHRDVKPGNILFNEQGTPKIVDFGLARPKETGGQSADGAEPIWGTPYYIAPEKLTGQPEDARSDIYSLGATLFHAMAGRPPFDAATAVDVAVKHATTPAYSLKTYVPQVQDATANVIGRMLAKNPAERYANYDELIADLEKARRAIENLGKRPVLVTQTGERVSVFSMVGTLAILLLLIAGAVFLWFKRDLFFGEPVPIVPPRPTSTQVVETVTAVVEDVDFPDNQPAGNTWNEAARKLAAGQFLAAVLDYELIQQQLRSKPYHVRWSSYAEGVALLLNNQTTDARASFQKAQDPKQQPPLPAAVTPNNFIGPLAGILLGKTPQADLDNAAALPPWAADLTQFNAGLRELSDARFAEAQRRFARYGSASVSNGPPWMYVFQPLAAKLARESGVAAQAVATAALKAFQDAQPQIQTPLLKKQLQAAAAKFEEQDKQARLKQEQERKAAEARAREEAERKEQELRRQQEAVLRQQTEADNRLFEAAETNNKKRLPVYDFNGLLAEYQALQSKIQSPDGRAKLEGRIIGANALVSLKQQLTAAFARQPFDAATIKQSTGAPFIGRLIRAGNTELVFSLPEGEFVREWRDLTPVSLLRIADFYARSFAATDKPEQTAARFMSLAVFCKEYDLAQFADAYAQAAVKLLPALQPDITKALGN